MEIKDGIELHQQTSFPPHTGLPRWGCFWMAMGGWPQLRMKKALTIQEILAIYEYVRTAKTQRNEYVLEMEEKKFKLNCQDPKRALQIWLDAIAPGRFQCWQTGSQAKIFTWVPKEVFGKETFRLWRFTTMRSGKDKGHFMLTDLKGNIVYNPDTSIQLKEQSNVYRSFYVREESIV